ncbi:MAG: DNA-3-methyladenine glycosylase I [Ilumatobacteraceae bacterium]
MTQGLRTHTDGLLRCWWCGDDPLYVEYHDREWGRPVHDDTRLFEKICLEGFQSGLSWLTILRKRENFRRAFANFDIGRVAQFSNDDVARLLSDAGIVRHKGKIESTINNARRCQELIAEFGSLDTFVWGFVTVASASSADLPTQSAESVRLSKELKRRGWSFVGPTTMYAFLQSVGVVNDHLSDCWVRRDAQA